MLVRKLIAGCERVVLGYSVRRERFSAEFSQGVENVAWDSDDGMNAPIFVRTVKLKDFPWNGWLRLGIATKPAAAWNPIAGFSDPAGRLLWAALGDPAFLAAPYSATWVANRAVPSSTIVDVNAGVTIPDDALAVDPVTGALREVGKGKTAKAKITYRLRASAFHDNTRMTAADLVYPYILASRWSARRAPGSTEYDAAVDAATALPRRALAGFKVVRVDTEVKKYSDITFTYIVPVIDVYLHFTASDPQQLAALAPPWSTVPWHVLVLMEEAVKRGLGAFSAEEARRRGVRWIDLARDPKLKEALGPLVEAFRKEAYVPESLRKFVTADEAETRWTALGQFSKRRGHFLVTNGPYRLSKWGASSVTARGLPRLHQSHGRRELRPVLDPAAGLGRPYRPQDRRPRCVSGDRAGREVSAGTIGSSGSRSQPRARRRTDRTCRCAGTWWWAPMARWSPPASRARRRGSASSWTGRAGSGRAAIRCCWPSQLGDNAINPDVATANYRVEAGP